MYVYPDFDIFFASKTDYIMYIGEMSTVKVCEAKWNKYTFQPIHNVAAAVVFCASIDFMYANLFLKSVFTLLHSHTFLSSLFFNYKG